MNKLFEKLRRPFPESSIEFVVTWTYGDDYNSAILGVAPYIKREAVIVRLDHVVGPESWKNEISPQAYGLYNGISIRNGDDWITKLALEGLLDSFAKLLKPLKITSFNFEYSPGLQI
jgi:hypothetical protein